MVSISVLLAESNNMMLIECRMMQIGMVIGFGTAMPVNWWLISQGIKEPCA